MGDLLRTHYARPYTKFLTLPGYDLDYLDGGAGADKLNGGSDPFDWDTAAYAGSNAAVIINLSKGEASGGYAEGDVLTGIANLVGSRFADRLTGDKYRNTLEGGAGADTLDGGKNASADAWDFASYLHSNSAVVASLDKPSINTGDAKGDKYINIRGFEGSALGDELHGDDEDNDLWGQGGDDILVVGTGADVAFGSFGFDVMSYRDLTSAITLNLQTWKSSSAVVNDDQGIGIEAFEATNYNDTIIGRKSIGDVLMGAGGNDTISGDSGNDHLNGGAGDDTLDGGTGADVLDGGDGGDIASYAKATKGITANLAKPTSNTNDAKGDTYIGIENVVGTAFNDKLYGNSGNNRLTGGDGADYLNGSTGTDTVDYRTSDAGVQVDLNANTAVGGHAEGDTITGFESVYGSAFNDKLWGDEAGNVLRAYDGNDWMDGRAGNDKLYGYDGNDTLYGDSGDDDLFGDDGDDKLIGETGSDDLTGGAGKDTFIFRSVSDTTNTASDNILDFLQSQDDLIDISAIDANTSISGLQTFKFVGTAAFKGVAGELRYVKEASDTYIYGDNDGDKTAEFRIHLDDAVTLVAGDFIL